MKKDTCRLSAIQVLKRVLLHEALISGLIFADLTTADPHQLSVCLVSLTCVDPGSPTKTMQNRREELVLDPASSAQRAAFMRATTYLSKVAVVLQDAPDQMLPFTLIMDKMAPLISEDRKSVENNIRVCLSSHKCFIKIPVDPNARESKKNYWKLDCSRITAKMVRRHFKGLLQLFPELASKVETVHHPALVRPPPAACRALQVRCEVKFSGPFSIESLLKTDRPSRAPPLSGVQVKSEQTTHTPAGTKRGHSWDCEERLLLQPAAGSSSICSTGGSTHHGLTANGVAHVLKRIPERVEPSFSIHARARAAPYFTSPRSSYVAYFVPALTHDVLRFSL